MKKVNEQSKTNNESDINSEKFDISLRGVIFAIIVSSVCIAGIAALETYQSLEDYTAAWAVAGFSLVTALLIFFSASYFFEKGIENGLERSKNMSPEQYSANLSKMIIGVILLFTSVICGYLLKSYANFFGIMVVLAVGLLSEGHHEEIVSNKKFTVGDMFSITLLAILTIFYLWGIDIIQCETQKLDVYVITQSLIITAGFTANTFLFYIKRLLTKQLLKKPKE